MKPSEHTAENRKIKKQPKDFSVKWKLFGYLCLFTAVIITLLWLCQVVFLNDIYKVVKTAEIKRAAKEITESIDSDELAEVAQFIARRNDVCILVMKMINSDNALRIFSVDQLDNCVIHRMSRIGVFTLYDSARQNGGKLLQHFRYDSEKGYFYSVKNTYFTYSDDEESIIYTLITKDANGTDVLVLLNSVITPITATVRTLNLLLIVISVLLLLMSLLLALIISRRISKPLIRINETAKTLASGNYDITFTGGGYREVNELNDTLNYAANELGKVDSLRRELIANISHDLRTPLTMITGYAEVMQDIPGENKPENLQVIIDESRRLTSLVNDTLDISKLESGNITVKPELVNITAAVSASVDRYAHMTAKDGYIITFDASEEVFSITDETRFLQAFCNLVNNALTYTGADKTVRVTQTLTYDQTNGKQHVRITVTDSGEGIDDEKLPLIWDRYYKIDSAHRRAATGTGLGLSIVRQLMELLHGACGVSSVRGEGSSFWIEVETAVRERAEYNGEDTENM